MTNPFKLLHKVKNKTEELTSMLDGLTEEEFNLLCREQNDFRKDVSRAAEDLAESTSNLIKSLSHDKMEL